jgi:hypothetical protein
MLGNLEESTNLVEVYFVRQQQHQENVIDIRIDESMLASVESKHKNWKTTKYMSYRRNHLTYLYDLTDDNQTVFTKIANSCKHLVDRNAMLPVVQMNYNYSKLPSHLFPCTKDIDDAQEYTISENKINNRISLNIKRDQFGAYLYIEYKHSPNVDFEKTQTIIQNLIKSI